MTFFLEHHSLTILQWILRGIVAFFFLLSAVKLMKQRSISQLRLLDLIMALTIGNIIAHPLADPHLSMKGLLVTILTLVVLYMTGVIFSLKWPGFRKFLEPSPYPVVENGKIVYKNLAKARISIDYLLSELRKEKIIDIRKVALALWEPGGTVSTFLMPSYDPATASDVNVQPKPFSFPAILIKEGKINYKRLEHAGKNKEWLINQLKDNGDFNPGDILLATIDNEGTLTFYPYKD